MIKIGLLTSSSLSDFRVKTIKPILSDLHFSIKVAIIDKRPELNLKQKIKKNLSRGRGGYIIIMAIKVLFSKKNVTISTVEFCRNNQIEIIETNNPYSQMTIDNIKKYNLDLLILAGGFGIVKQPLINITPIGVLSYHHGDMRKYRGMPPALWELYNNEKEMGITIQILSTGLDRGIPVCEKKIEINKRDTLKKLQKRASDESVDMLYNALLKLSKRNYKPEIIEEYGKIYTLPNLRQWIIFSTKIFWRRII